MRDSTLHDRNSFLVPRKGCKQEDLKIMVESSKCRKRTAHDFGDPSLDPYIEGNRKKRSYHVSQLVIPDDIASIVSRLQIAGPSSWKLQMLNPEPQALQT